MAMFSVYSDENDQHHVSTQHPPSSKATLVCSSSSAGRPLSSKRVKMAASAPILSAKSHTTAPTMKVYTSSCSDKQGYEPSSVQYKQSQPTSIARKPAATKEVQKPSSQQGPASKAAFMVFSDDKENIDPLGRRKALTNKQQKGKSSSEKASSQQQAALLDLWKGKQPFDYASPEKSESASRGSFAKASSHSSSSSSKSIYDLPGTKASRGYRLSDQSNPTATVRSSCSAVNMHSALAVSRPNKKKDRHVPIPLKKGSTFEVFKEPLPPASFRDKTVLSNLSAHEEQRPSTVAPVAPVASTLNSPVLLLADRKARQLTESPLADVTQAYTGRGRFSNSPTADSGFDSRETSVSPLPSSRSLSFSTASRKSREALGADGHLDATPMTHLDDLPTGLERLTLMQEAAHMSSSKRRISQVSNSSSRSREAAPASLLLSHSSSTADDGPFPESPESALAMVHINECDLDCLPSLPSGVAAGNADTSGRGQILEMHEPSTLHPTRRLLVLQSSSAPHARVPTRGKLSMRV